MKFANVPIFLLNEKTVDETPREHKYHRIPACTFFYAFLYRHSCASPPESLGPVVKAMPKYIPARVVKETLAKVAGPPPNVVTHIVPVGLLGSVAAQMPPSSEQVVVQALVNP